VVERILSFVGDDGAGARPRAEKPHHEHDARNERQRRPQQPPTPAGTP
jgi:hypothetical protein